jgi:hypothetical protein
MRLEWSRNFLALLYLPSELPVEKNHTEMVKFASLVDPTYLSVVKHIKDYMGAYT